MERSRRQTGTKKGLDDIDHILTVRKKGRLKLEGRINY